MPPTQARRNFSLQDKNRAEFLTIRIGCEQSHCFETKLPNLKLKTRPKQLLGSLPLDIALSDSALWT